MDLNGTLKTRRGSDEGNLPTMAFCVWGPPLSALDQSGDWHDPSSQHTTTHTPCTTSNTGKARLSLIVATPPLEENPTWLVNSVIGCILYS